MRIRTVEIYSKAWKYDAFALLPFIAVFRPYYNKAYTRRVYRLRFGWGFWGRDIVMEKFSYPEYDGND